jgi:hypothetical protein
MGKPLAHFAVYFSVVCVACQVDSWYSTCVEDISILRLKRPPPRSLKRSQARLPKASPDAVILWAVVRPLFALTHCQALVATARARMRSLYRVFQFDTAAD